MLLASHQRYEFYKHNTVLIEPLLLDTLSIEILR